MESAPDLVLLTERLYRSWEALDYEAMIEAIARDHCALMVGSDPGEWWAGHEVITAVMRTQTQEMPQIHFEVEEIVAVKRRDRVGRGQGSNGSRRSAIR